jgi:DNA polymerase
MANLMAAYWRLLRLTEDYFSGQTRSEQEYTVPELCSPAPSLADCGVRKGVPPASEKLDDIRNEVVNCRLCRLSERRANAVPGEGVLNPMVMVIGEGPGAAEDSSGRPFVGPAGIYLDKWLAAIQLNRRTNCFIANLVKCRPPGNRDPNPDEASTCMSYLQRQIDALSPKVLLVVGRVSANHLLGVTRTLAQHRTERYEYQGRPLFVTYHPSAVLRDHSLRSSVWNDLKKLRSFLDTA